MSILLVYFSILLTASGAGSTEKVMTSGPVVGRVTTDRIHIWCRVDAPGRQIVGILLDEKGQEVSRVLRVSSELSDLTADLLFEDGVRAGQKYRYRIEVDGEVAADFENQRIETPSSQFEEVRFVFGSCASKKYVRADGIWQVIADREPHQVIFLGDTPYIDSTDLEKQRAAYREFWKYPGLKRLARSTSMAATWDDHDYGLNDAVGEISHRNRSRKAFLEYHALGEVGDTRGGGIYTRIQRGPVEVFLLDTRWYGNTAPSPVDAEKPTLLGKNQWDWLKKGLLESTSPFKIISSGMIFNGSVRPGKKDHWMHFAHERNGLMKFIGDNKITGVFIVTGDIHRCRHLSYPAEEGAGYPVDEWISSPLGNSVIESANVAHPALVFDAGEKGVFLSVEARGIDGDVELWSRLINLKGETIHEKRYLASDLKPSR